MVESALNTSSSLPENADDDPIRVLVHDLRGQLSALLSAARLLELSPGDVRQATEVVAIVRRQVEVLDRKIGQLGRAKSESLSIGEPESLGQGDATVSGDPSPTGQRNPFNPSRQPLRVLVVDDDRSAAHLLSRLLAKLGCDALTVSSGEAALQAFGNFAPQVVITDQEMPGMKGDELARQIRGGNDSQPILIAMSGHDPGALPGANAASDFDYVLSKPAGLEALEQLLASIGASRL